MPDLNDEDMPEYQNTKYRTYMYCKRKVKIKLKLVFSKRLLYFKA